MYNIACADVLDWAAEYDGPKFHAILTDPPYGWHFMGRKRLDGAIALQPDTWAALAQHLHPGAFIMAFGGPRTYHRLACALEDAGLRLHNPLGWLQGQGFPKATRIDTQIDKAAGANREKYYRPTHYPDSDNWGKPNQHGSVNRGYGGSFGVDVQDGMRADTHPATDLARAWQGHRYGLQALKPAIEFIAIARVPYVGRPVDCIVETGAGALNIDEARIGLDNTPPQGGPMGVDSGTQIWGNSKGGWESNRQAQPQGRWPANFALCHSPGCRRAGVKRVKGDKRGTTGGKIQVQPPGQHGIYGTFEGADRTPAYGDPDGLETVNAYDCTEDCPVRLLGEQSGRLNSGERKAGQGNHPEVIGPIGLSGKPNANYYPSNSGTAARFFFQADWSYEVAERLAGLEMPVMYCPKASRRERNDGLDDFYWRRDKSSPTGFVRVTKEEWETLGKKERAQGNIHPTQKPISLTKWLATLLLPPKDYAPRRILVPFAGKMSEGVGAMLAGFEEIEAVELIQDYCDAGKARMEFWSDGRQLELAL